MDEVSLKIAIHCTDFAASRAFYADILGLPVVDEWDEPHVRGCIVAVGAGLLELRQTLGADGTERGRAPQTTEILLRVARLDDWLARLDGTWEHTKPKTQPWGERTVRMRDPDGVQLTIYQETATATA